MNKSTRYLEQTASLRCAMEALEESGSKIIACLDDAKRLVGVVTDGDIRRAMLNGGDLTGNVGQALNQTPVTVSQRESEDAVTRLLSIRGLSGVPVLDDQGVFVHMLLSNTTQVTPSFANPVFIMAGGFGTRLMPLTEQCPKPMLEVGGVPLLERNIKQFVRSGFSKFYISTHYLPHVIKEYFGDGADFGADITYVHEPAPLGTGGALSLIPKPQSLPIIMINGDVLTNLDFSKLLRKHESYCADITMCLRSYRYTVPYGVVVCSGEDVVTMEEKPVYRYDINAGIYVISPDVLGNVPSGRVDMPDIVKLRIKDKHKVVRYDLVEYWLDIGSHEDYHRANKEVEYVR